MILTHRSCVVVLSALVLVTAGTAPAVASPATAATVTVGRTVGPVGGYVATLDGGVTHEVTAVLTVPRAVCGQGEHGVVSLAVSAAGRAVAPGRDSLADAQVTVTCDGTRARMAATAIVAGAGPVITFGVFVQPGDRLTLSAASTPESSRAAVTLGGRPVVGARGDAFAVDTARVSADRYGYPGSGFAGGPVVAATAFNDARVDGAALAAADPARTVEVADDGTPLAVPSALDDTGTRFSVRFPPTDR